MPCTPEQLEIDHVDGRPWVIATVRALERTAIYWREHRAGVRLRALCRTCNGTTGGGMRYSGRTPRRTVRVIRLSSRSR